MLIFATGSAARRKLIKMCKKNAVFKNPKIDERRFDKENVYDYLQRVTYMKAVSFVNKNSIVAAADTIIFYKDKIIGKPINRENAFEILSMLSGNYHCCFSAATILSMKGYEFFTDYAVVYMDKLNSEQINLYLDSNEYKNRAAGYAIQGLASNFLRVVKGDINTVIGFPMKKLCRII